MRREAVRRPLTAKVHGDGLPVCYCFGFAEGDAHEEIAKAGRSTVSSTISALIKAGMCAHEVRNPSGQCCLGQVNQIVKATLG